MPLGEDEKNRKVGRILTLEIKRVSFSYEKANFLFKRLRIAIYEYYECDRKNKKERSVNFI